MLLVAYFISAFAVSKYAKAVRDKKGSILAAEQMDACRAAYGTSAEVDENTKLTGRQKGVLVIFGLSFVIMILGFIPWEDLSEGAFNAFGWSAFLTGNPFSWWWFDDAAIWFLLMGIIIGLVGLDDKSKIMSCIVSGFADMISVNLVIALARVPYETWLKWAVKVLAVIGVVTGVILTIAMLILS